MTGAEHCTCITCRDAASEMRVLRRDEDRGLALCEDGEGRRRAVDLGLLDSAAPGDVVLVHADVAIARLQTELTG